MSASPEHQADSHAVSAEHDEPEKAPTPITGDDDEGDKAAEAEAGEQDEQPEENDQDSDGVLSDDESILSEVDEAEFENFDPENVEVDERPQLAIDEDNLKLIGRHKRKRADGEEGRPRRKEGRREKKSRRARDDEEGGGMMDRLADRRKRRRRRLIQMKRLWTPRHVVDEPLTVPWTKL